MINGSVQLVEEHWQPAEAQKYPGETSPDAAEYSDPEIKIAYQPLWPGLEIRDEALPNYLQVQSRDFDLVEHHSLVVVVDLGLSTEN